MADRIRRKIFTVLVCLPGLLAAQETSSPLPPIPQPKGLLDVYEANRLQGVPSFVTADLLLTAHGMLLSEALISAEERLLLPALEEVVEGLAASLGQAEENDAVANANRQFVEVLALLLDRSGTGRFSTAQVRTELELIEEASGIADSPLFGQKLDYSQLRVRGHYGRNDDLRRYFLAARYASLGLFPVLASPATGISETDASRLTAQALQLAALLGEPPLSRPYGQLMGTLEWAFGPPDDLTANDLREATAGVDAANVKEALMRRARETGRRPQIVAAVVDVSKLASGSSIEDVLTGWRLLPGRRSPSSMAFQDLVYPRVGAFKGVEVTPRSAVHRGGFLVKGFPSALEYAGLLGSGLAIERLDATGERAYAGYERAWQEAESRLQGADGLAMELALVFGRWLGAAETDTVTAKDRVEAILAAWVRYRHAGLLYLKQSMTPVGKGIGGPPRRRKAWLEPEPELYLLMARLERMVAKQMQAPVFGELARIYERCAEIALQELAGLPLDDADVDFLNKLDAVLLMLAGSKDGPVVVDIHGEPGGGRVVELGVAWPRVVAHQFADGATARGARSTVCEFLWPLEDRLDDEKWKGILNSDDFDTLWRIVEGGHLFDPELGGRAVLSEKAK